MSKISSITKILIFLPTAFIAWFFPFFAVNASDTGINVFVYNNFGYNQSPPLPDVSGRPLIGSTVLSQINQNFDGFPLFQLYEDFIVKYEGYITAPESTAITFWPQADDGTKFFLDGVLIDNNWRDKGGGGNVTAAQQFSAGESKPFTYWFYENGGGAWTTLYWNVGNGWEIVPASAFTRTPVATTTSTLPNSLGKPTNVTLTDTGNGILVDWNAPEDNVGVSPERYAISWSTSNSGWGVATGNVGDENALNTSILLDYSLFSSTGGLGAEYKITVRADNDTNSVYSEQSDEVLLKIGTSPPPPTTTTSTTTTIPTTTTSSTVAPTTTTTEASIATTTTTTSTTAIPQTTVPKPEIQPQTTTTTTLIPTTTSTTVEPVGVTELLAAAKTAEEITKAVDSILDAGIDKDEAKELATNPEVLQSVTKEQAVELFNSLDEGELTEAEAQQLVDAVQAAPEEVREAFEEEVNVFAGAFDEYVPVDSKISVGERRVVVAASAVLSISSSIGSAVVSSTSNTSTGNKNRIGS